MYPTYKVDLDAKTVTHTSGIIFKFVEHSDGGWIKYPSDEAIKYASGKSDEELAGIASRAGDAWQAALTERN